MTNDPCKYCGRVHGLVGDTVCGHTQTFFAKLAGGNSNFIRVQQFFAHEIQYNFKWQPPNNVPERKYIEQKEIGKHYHKSKMNKSKYTKKYYYDPNKTTINTNRGKDQSKGNRQSIGACRIGEK